MNMISEKPKIIASSDKLPNIINCVFSACLTNQDGSITTMASIRQRCSIDTLENSLPNQLTPAIEPSLPIAQTTRKDKIG